MADEAHCPRIVSSKGHFEIVLAEQLSEAVTPLDHRNGLIERGIEIKVIELGEPGQAIGINVDQLGTAVQ